MVFFSVALQTNSGLDRHTFDISRSHTNIDRHTHTHTHPVGLLWRNDRLVAEAATYTIQNKRKRRTSMPSEVMEPEIPATGWPQAHAPDRTATGIGIWLYVPLD